MTTPRSWSVNQLAARAVALHASGPPSERLELLEALGLIADDRREIVPDDTKAYLLEDVGKAPGAKDPNASTPRAFAEHGRRPDGMTTPPGLAALLPAADPPKPARRPRPVATSHCGTIAGYKRHQRHGEKPCESCTEGARAHWQDRNKARPRPARVRRTEIECGTTSGYSWHQRRKEPTCAACRDAIATYQRERAARRRQEAQAS